MLENSVKSFSKHEKAWEFLLVVLVGSLWQLALSPGPPQPSCLLHSEAAFSEALLGSKAASHPAPTAPVGLTYGHPATTLPALGRVPSKCGTGVRVH